MSAPATPPGPPGDQQWPSPPNAPTTGSPAMSGGPGQAPGPGPGLGAPPPVIQPGMPPPGMSPPGMQPPKPQRRAPAGWAWLIVLGSVFFTVLISFVVAPGQHFGAQSNDAAAPDQDQNVQKPQPSEGEFQPVDDLCEYVDPNGYEDLVGRSVDGEPTPDRSDVQEGQTTMSCQMQAKADKDDSAFERYKFLITAKTFPSAEEAQTELDDAKQALSDNDYRNNTERETATKNWNWLTSYSGDTVQSQALLIGQDNLFLDVRFETYDKFNDYDYTETMATDAINALR